MDRTQTFLEEIRAFLSESLTPDLRLAGRQTIGTHSDITACHTWHKRLYERGWIAPAWPSAYGGTGWSSTQRFLFEQECALNDAPILFGTGIRSLGPLLVAIGTPEQQSRYINPILKGEDLWCQGFSEPSAGSDLAALTTRAISDGNDYSVTGSKIWTTGAHYANRMFALVRTSQGSRPQEGITFLLIDMDTPGITIKPILSFDDEHEFNQVFFDNVRVPKANRVGIEGDGWAVAKHLMRFARSNNTTSGLLRRAFRRIEELVSDQQFKDPALILRKATLEIDLKSFESFELRLLTSGRLTGDDEIASSLMKCMASELHQKITELGIEAAGSYGTGNAASVGKDAPPYAKASRAMQKYFGTRAASIYSGTNETHRNIISRSLLNFAKT